MWLGPHLLTTDWGFVTAARDTTALDVDVTAGRDTAALDSGGTPARDTAAVDADGTAARDIAALDVVVTVGRDTAAFDVVFTTARDAAEPNVGGTFGQPGGGTRRMVGPAARGGTLLGSGAACLSPGSATAAWCPPAVFAVWPGAWAIFVPPTLRQHLVWSRLLQLW